MGILVKKSVIVILTPQLITDYSSISRGIFRFCRCAVQVLIFNGQFQGYDLRGKEREKVNSSQLKVPFRNSFFIITQVFLRINQ